MTEELTLEELSRNQDRRRKERRYKILSVDIETVLSLLYPIGEQNIISRIKLPEDVHPIDVHYSMYRQSFLFLLESESFECVEPGLEVPYIDGNEWCVSRNHVIFEENYQTDEKTVRKFMEDIRHG